MIFDFSRVIFDLYSIGNHNVRRTAIIDKLEALGLFRGKQDNPMVVPICRFALFFSISQRFGEFSESDFFNFSRKYIKIR